MALVRLRYKVKSYRIGTDKQQILRMSGTKPCSTTFQIPCQAKGQRTGTHCLLLYTSFSFPHSAVCDELRVAACLRQRQS